MDEQPRTVSVDTVIGDLRDTLQHLSNAVESIDTTDGVAGELVGRTRDLGAHGMADGLVQLRTRLEAVAAQLALATTALAECITMAEDAKYGKGKRDDAPPSTSSRTELRRESALRTYAGPTLLSVWAAMNLVGLVTQVDDASWWGTVYSMLIVAYLSTLLFGKRRRYSRGYDIFLWMSAIVMLAVLVARVVIDGRPQWNGSFLGGTAFLIAILVMIVLYRRKRSDSV